MNALKIIGKAAKWYFILDAAAWMFIGVGRFWDDFWSDKDYRDLPIGDIIGDQWNKGISGHKKMIEAVKRIF